MAKRNRKANRTSSKNTQVRPQSPVAPDQPVTLPPGAPDKDSLVGAILAAAEDQCARVTVPELRAPKVPAVDPMGETIVGHPVVDVAPTPAVQAAPTEQRADDDLHNSLDDFDAAFFSQPDVETRALRAKQESFPPVAEDILAEKRPEPPSPEVLARRSRLRKVVAGIVAVAAVVVIGGLGKNLVAGERPLSSMHTNAAMAVTARAADPTPVAAPEAVAEAPLAVAIPAPPALPEPVEEPAVEAKPAEPAVAVPDGVNPKAETLRLLNVGKMNDAVPMAKAAIAADPSDALPYLYLGTALQELGKQKEAIAAYSDCVQNATKGRVWECSAMGGKK